MYKIVILLLLCATGSRAQERYTLQQCVAYTLRNNPTIAQQENNISIAKAKSRQALSGYLPQVTGTVTSLNNLKLQASVLPAGLLGPEPREIALGTRYNTNATVDVSQTIYDQAKIIGIKANKPYSEITRLQLEQSKEMLIYNTGVAFFQVHIYREQLDVLNANRLKYEEMIKVLQHQYEKGTVLEKDVDRIKVTLGITNYQIKDAATKELLAINTLKNAMGMPLEEGLDIGSSVNYELFVESTSHGNVVMDDLIDVKIGKQSVLLQRFNLKTKQASYLPTLSAIARFGQQALASDFSNMYKDWMGFSYVGLSLNIPIFNGFKRRNEVSEEKLKLKNEELNFDISKRNLKLHFENAKTSLGTAYSSYLSNKDNLALARKLLDVTDYQYLHGVAGLTDYLNDDIAYKEAQSNYINSLYNLMISQLDYHKSKGSLWDFLNRIQ